MEKYYKSTFWILSFIVLVFLLKELKDYIFYEYPEFIKEVYDKYICPFPNKEYGYNIGTFGDMYGALNSFLSGLAFLGLITTILLQIYIHQREVSIEKEKSIQEKIKEEDKLKSVDRDKMIYLLNLINRILNNDRLFLEDLGKWLDNNSNETITVPIYVKRSTNSEYDLITNKINQEEYFTSYRHYFNDLIILDAFGIIERKLAVKKFINSGIDNLINLSNEENAKFALGLKEIRKACAQTEITRNIFTSFFPLNTPNLPIDSGVNIVKNMLMEFEKAFNDKPNLQKELIVINNLCIDVIYNYQRGKSNKNSALETLRFSYRDFGNNLDNLEPVRSRLQTFL